LKQLGKFSEGDARFIISEVILGLQYLHENLIIYRDLKPENIMLTLEGNIKIVDFGLSKQCKIQFDKAYTFAGTTEYLAPEIIMRLGHDQSVDLWTLGIFLFELLSGNPPFCD